MFLLAALLLLATNIQPGTGIRSPAPGEAPLLYTPVSLAADDPARRDVGRLHYPRRLDDERPDDRLGGLSGLRIEGSEAIAISDAGMIVRFPLPGASPAPRVRFQPVGQGPEASRERRSRDTESLWVEGGRLWLTFERQNAVWRYDRSQPRRAERRRAGAPARWRRNSGAGNDRPARRRPLPDTRGGMGQWQRGERGGALRRRSRRARARPRRP